MLPARASVLEIVHLLDVFHSTYPLFHLISIYSFLAFGLRCYPVHVTDFLPSHLIFFLILAFIVSTPFIELLGHNFPVFAPLRSSFLKSLGLGDFTLRSWVGDLSATASAASAASTPRNRFSSVPSYLFPHFDLHRFHSFLAITLLALSPLFRLVHFQACFFISVFMITIDRYKTVTITVTKFVTFNV
jgi:hypothetical protein